MTQNRGAFARLPLKCFLLSMILAVFALGLHARIELIRAGKSNTWAKISTSERPSAQAATHVVVDETPADVPPVYWQRLVRVLYPESASLLRSRAVKASLWRPSRPGTVGPSLLLRPPPVKL